MKLKKALLRWYKSFHLNYRGQTEKGETTSYRPWDDLSPEFAKGEKFPFIEIPIENDITTIVGANESGKSHLLNAITKAFRGTATDNSDKFKRTDLCHFAGIRTRNVEACPNLGLQFVFESVPNDELSENSWPAKGSLPHTRMPQPLPSSLSRWMNKLRRRKRTYISNRILKHFR